MTVNKDMAETYRQLQVSGVLVFAFLFGLWWLTPAEPVEPAVPTQPIEQRDDLPAAEPTGDAPTPTAPPEVALPLPEELDPAADLQARAQELEERGSTDVICHIEPAIEQAQGHLLVGPPDGGPPYNGRIVQVVLGRAFLPYLDNRWTRQQYGWLAVPGYAPTRIDWSVESGQCTPNPIALDPSEVMVSGTIRNAEGEPEGKVFVEGCGNQAWTDSSGNYALDALPGSCSLEAFRRDGMWTARTEPVSLELEVGKDEVVDFALPPERRGGMGLQVEAVDAGILVMKVIEGGGADGLDVQHGDVIVELNGIESVDMTLREFVDEAVGAHGTDVEITVLRDGVEHDLTVTRKAMD